MKTSNSSLQSKKIIITGGTGFIAQALAAYFGKNNRIVLLSRQSVHDSGNHYHTTLLQPSDGYNITYWRWDGQHVEKHWARELEGSDIVINLAGKSVNCRYTQKNKKEILESRIKATELIGKAIRQCQHPPQLWINAASATIYKNTLDEPNDEYHGIISDWKKDNMPYSLLDRIRFGWKRILRTLRFGIKSEKVQELDLDFSVQVCKAWENTFFQEPAPFTRKAALRTAITLGEGGVMVPYFNLARFGLGGTQGNGRQRFSWIHVEDLARIIEWIYNHPEMDGIYNCSAPNPVGNEEFMKNIRSNTGNKWGLPAGTCLLEAGAALIGTETELILKSRWVLPARLLESGFQFKYAHLNDALKDIVSITARRKSRIY